MIFDFLFYELFYKIQQTNRMVINKIASSILEVFGIVLYHIFRIGLSEVKLYIRRTVVTLEYNYQKMVFVK